MTLCANDLIAAPPGTLALNCGCVTQGRQPLPDGRLGEIFVANHKRSNAADVVVRDAGILMSLLLQHGCAVGVIANAISRDADGSPSGVIGAVLDLIAERP
jgi:hypothetical protein